MELELKLILELLIEFFSYCCNFVCLRDWNDFVIVVGCG